MAPGVARAWSGREKWPTAHARAVGVPADPCWLSKATSRTVRAMPSAGEDSRGFSRMMGTHKTSEIPGVGDVLTRG